MAKEAGFWAASEDNESDVVGIDFTPNLGSATISGTPTVEGVNCTATLVNVDGAVVNVRYTDGEYAGKVVVTAPLSDGRSPVREVQLRFS